MVTFDEAKSKAFKAMDNSLKSGLTAGVAIIAAISVGAADAGVGASKALGALRDGYVLHAAKSQAMNEESAKRAFKRDSDRAILALKLLHADAMRQSGQNDTSKPNAGAMAHVIGTMAKELDVAGLRALVYEWLAKIGATSVTSYFELTKPKADAKDRDAKKERAAIVAKVGAWNGVELSDLIRELQGLQASKVQLAADMAAVRAAAADRPATEGDIMQDAADELATGTNG